jgi:hypothetical protein
MAQMDIPPAKWPEFLNEFNRLHHGWLVTVGVVDTDLLARAPHPQAYVVSEQVPLEEIRASAGGEDVAIVTGRERGRIAHYVHHPMRLLVDRSAEGADESLRIDDDAGRSTLLRFRTTLPQEALNGLAGSEL